jgi:hypothetical protein
MVLHWVGVFISTRAGRNAMGHALVQYRCPVSLFSVSIFWIKSIFLGVGCELPSDYLLFNTVVM